MTTLDNAPEQLVNDLVLSYLAAGRALPGEVYTSEGLFAREMSAVFGRQWLYAGHVSQILEPGDYLTVTVGDESCIVVRDQSGAINGLLNVCRHRGSRLVESDCGKARMFTCPYHQWTYDRDGSLVGAPRMPKGFDKAQFPLKTVHTAVWQGLIFVNFSANPVEPLEELLQDPTDLMAPFDIASARVAHIATYEVDANWKLVWENSQECYHCNANHPEFIRTFDNRAFVQPDLADAPMSFTDDRRMQFGTFPLKIGAQSLTMTGEPASTPLLGEFAEGREPYTAATHLKPGFAAVFSPDYGIVFTDVPVSASATRVRVQWLVHAEAVDGVDYETDNLIRVWDQTNRQDWDLCRSVQQGVRSRGFEPGPLSLDESAVAGFYYAYARMMSAAGQ
jgi:phenylpropionate dioxygenase-like ring-hydroxylating dioxygenase large terminal subunit